MQEITRRRISVQLLRLEPEPAGYITPMRTRRVLLVLALAAALPAAQAQTGKWPDKPVRVVVQFPPGGATDIAARMIAPRLAEEYGQPLPPPVLHA